MSNPTESVEIAVFQEDDFHGVQLRGSICDEGTSLVQKTILDLISPDISRLAIDCEHVEYVSSSGIGMLVSALKTAHREGVSLTLCALSDELRELFSLTRLDQVFQLAESMDAYRKSLDT